MDYWQELIGRQMDGPVLRPIVRHRQVTCHIAEVAVAGETAPPMFESVGSEWRGPWLRSAPWPTSAR